MLRAHHCVRCGDPMPLGRRVDRKYCRASCRTSAYRTRRRQTAPRREARTGQAQQTTEPLPPELVLALRQVPPAVLTALAAWFGEHASSEQLTGARQRITELERQVERLRSEQAAQNTAHARDKEHQREQESEQRMREQKAREAELRQRADAATGRITELQSTVQRLEAEAAERNREHEFYARNVQEDFARVMTNASELRNQLEQSKAWNIDLQTRLVSAEQEARERQKKPKPARSAAKTEARPVRRETQPKRQPRASVSRSVGLASLPPPPAPSLFEEQQEDELLSLMMEYVTVRDALARKEGDPYLPDRTQRTIEAHALRLANKYRHEYYDRRDRVTDHRPHWLDYGQRLDAVSEALLRAEVRLKIQKLKRKLEGSI